MSELMTANLLPMLATIDAAAAPWMAVLASDLFRFFVLAFGLFAVYTSIKIPGSGVAEFVALLCAVMLLVPPMQSGLAQWFEVLAVVVGLVLIAVEVFLLPGVGVAGLTGSVLALGGVILTFLPPFDGATGVSMHAAMMATLLVIGAFFVGTVGWFAVGPWLSRLPYFRRIVLNTTVGEPVTIGPGTPELRPALGTVGITTADLRPGGPARFVLADGTTIAHDVVSDRGFIPAGREIVVVDVEGNRVVVRSRGGAA